MTPVTRCCGTRVTGNYGPKQTAAQFRIWLTARSRQTITATMPVSLRTKPVTFEEAGLHKPRVLIIAYTFVSSSNSPRMTTVGSTRRTLPERLPDTTFRSKSSTLSLESSTRPSFRRPRMAHFLSMNSSAPSLHPIFYPKS